MPLARVVTFAHEIYTVETTGGEELTTELSGRLRYSGDLWPAVGDWVEVRGGIAIDEVVARKNTISRKDPGTRNEEQILAANVDVAFVVSGLDGDFNIRRIERYLVLAEESRVRPVLVLNKADLIPDRTSIVEILRPVARDIPVEFVSACMRDVQGLCSHVQRGETAVLLGSSGVGKSTIVNALLGCPLQKTNAVREADSRGRHTTTQRHLLTIPGGWFLIDTPGLREVQLWADAASVDSAFDEIAELAEACHFTNCSHSSEPGCAVIDAVENGSLDRSRLDSFYKLRREAAFLDRKQDPRAMSEYQRNIKQIMRSVRHHPKYKR